MTRVKKPPSREPVPAKKKLGKRKKKRGKQPGHPQKMPKTKGTEPGQEKGGGKSGCIPPRRQGRNLCQKFSKGRRLGWAWLLKT